MISSKKLTIFILPIVIYIIFYDVIPLINVVIESFSGGNYQEVLSDPKYIQSIINSFIYGIGISILGITSALALAMLMYSITSKRLLSTLYMSTYTTHLLSWVVIFGMFNAIFMPTGLVNSILINQEIITQPIQFWAYDNFSRFMIIIMTVWKDLGYTALIFYIALLSIPTNLIEAVSLEKDTLLNKAKTIYIPHLRGIIATMTILIFVGALKTFDSAYIAMNPINKDAVQTPATYAYELATLKHEAGLAAAASVIFMLICIAMLFVVKKVVNKK